MRDGSDWRAAGNSSTDHHPKTSPEPQHFRNQFFCVNDVIGASCSANMLSVYGNRHEKKKISSCHDDVFVPAIQIVPPVRYLEGAQHDRAVHVSGNLEGRRISTCDTSIFFMQTSEAARRWPVTQEGVDQLICAFGGRPFSGTPFHKTAAPAVPNLVSVKGCSKQSLDGTYILHSVDYAQRSGGNSDARTPSVVYKHQKLAWGKQHWLYSQFEEKDQQSPIGKHQGESRKKKTRALCPIRWFIGHDRVSSRKVQSSAVGRAGSAVGYVNEAAGSCNTNACYMCF